MSQEHSQKHLIRLQKYIADCGITSRRKAEHYILEGRVTVNNEIVDTLGTKICPKTDVVSVDGEVADLRSVQKIYVLMHKPRAYITSVSDPENRPTVIDLIKEVSERIYPVGRLDYLSEGLLILTNDGDLAQQIMHPSFEVEKVYEVKVFGAITDSLLRAMRGDVLVDGVRMKPKAVRVIKQLPGKTWLEFRLNEGKNREIRKICEAHGLTVDKLKRVAIGQLTIDGIAPGKSRFVSRSYIEKMVFSQAARSQGFFSGKKTVDLKKKGPQNPIAADSEIFRKFRRESYYETVQKIKEFKDEKAKANPVTLTGEQDGQHFEEQSYADRFKENVGDYVVSDRYSSPRPDSRVGRGGPREERQDRRLARSSGFEDSFSSSSQKPERKKTFTGAFKRKTFGQKKSF